MKTLDIFLAILLTLVWGFNFVVIEVGLGSFPPILFSALRFICAAFPAILFIKRRNIRWRWIILIGFSLGVVMFGLLFIGMDVGMPAGLSSLVIQIQAVFTLLLSALILHDSPTSWQKVGMIIAFSGIGLIIACNFHSTNFLGLVLVICAGFAWAASNILLKLLGKIDIFRLIIWMSIVPPLPLLFISALFEEGQLQAISNMTWLGVGTIFYTGLISTVFAFAIWGKLLSEYSPNTVAPILLLVPIFGIIFSALFLNEKLSSVELASSLLVFMGLFLIVFGKKILTFFIIKQKK